MKSVTVSIVPPSICHEEMGLDAVILVFWMLNLKPAFSLSIFTLISGFYFFAFCHYNVQFSSFSRSVVSHSLRPHSLQHARPPCPSPTPSFLKLMSIESVMPSNYFILCRRLLLLPSIFPSITVLSNESALHIRWPKYWSLSFSISPSERFLAI